MNAVLKLQPESDALAFAKDKKINTKLLKGLTRLTEASFNNPDLKQTRVIQRLLNPKCQNKHMILILGDTGCGKTWGAMAKMAQELRTGSFTNDLGHDVPYVRWDVTGRPDVVRGDMITAYTLAELLDAPWQHKDRLERLKTTGWVLLDDLGTEPTGKSGERFLSYFQGLVDERYQHRRPLIMTSNKTPEEFREAYGKRLLSRLNESGIVIQSDDADMRGQEAMAV
jgi:DNA replication protein DnaC